VTLPASLASAVESWAALYDHHQLVSVGVRYLHLAALIVGGGTALATDRQLIAAARSGPRPPTGALLVLSASHRVVVPALAVVVATGLLMTATDTDTFLGSRLYWSKMGLVGLLLLNGIGLLAAERAVADERAMAWWWLGLTSVVSLVLWLSILFAGVWLTAAA
jgi:hypothetical protein